MQHTDEILNPKEVSELLGISYNQVLALVAEGKLPALQIGERPYKFSRQALVDYFYFGSLSNMADKMQAHTGVDFCTMMEWIMKFRNYRDKTETELVRTAKQTLDKMKELYAKELPPDPVALEELAEALKKVEVFNPQPKKRGEADGGKKSAPAGVR